MQKWSLLVILWRKETAIAKCETKYVVLEMQGIDPRTSRMLSERSTI